MRTPSRQSHSLVRKKVNEFKISIDKIENIIKHKSNLRYLSLNKDNEDFKHKNLGTTYLTSPLNYVKNPEILDSVKAN